MRDLGCFGGRRRGEGAPRTGSPRARTDFPRRSRQEQELPVFFFLSVTSASRALFWPRRVAILVPDAETAYGARPSPRTEGPILVDNR